MVKVVAVLPKFTVSGPVNPVPVIVTLFPWRLLASGTGEPAREVFG
jgi:hypothetical protein